jgi:nitrogen fixation-related uncharacterized protein
MDEKRKSNWRIILIQLLIAIALVIVLVILASKTLYFGIKIGKYYNQQECNINILSIQLSNASPSLKEYYLQQIYSLCQIYNEELGLIDNFTTNNG